MNIINKNISRLIKLCEEYKVVKLYAFGSVINNKLTQESDIDLLVTFDNIDLLEYADNYFNLKFSLEDLFKRKVDLLEENAIKNPFFFKSIDSSKKIVYGQRNKNLVI